MMNYYYIMYMLEQEDHQHTVVTADNDPSQQSGVTQSDELDYHAPTISGDLSDELDELGDLPDDDSDQQSSQDDVSVVSLKKFELVNNLTMLRNKLQYRGISIDDLNTLVTFAPYLSYQTLLRAADRLLQVIHDVLKTKFENVRGQS